MKAASSLAVAGAVLALAAGAAGAAGSDGSVRIVEAGGATFPNRAYVLTLPTPRSLSTSQVDVTENGLPVPDLAVVSEGGTTARRFGVVLAIDASESMRGKPIEDALAAARAFASHRHPNQALAVIAFDGKVRVIQPFTTNSAKIRAALSKPPKISYGTKIYDAINKSLGMIAAAGIRPGSIVLLSDGADVGSVAKPKVVLRHLSNGHVRVFTVGLESPAYDPAALTAVSKASKGSTTTAQQASELTPIFDQLGARLSHEYLVTYRSLATPDKKVAVRISVAGLPGAATSSYISPNLEITAAPPYHPSFLSRVVQSWVTAAIIALLIAGLLGWAVLNVFRDRREPLVDRVGDFVAVQREPAKADDDLAGPKRISGFLGKAEQSIERLGWTERLGKTLALADIDMTPGQLVLLTGAATALVMLVLYLIIGPIGILVGLVVPFIVRAVVLNKLERKRRAFADQLPDNLDVLASSLRAGHSLIGGLAVVVEDAAEPSKGELRRALAEEQLGVPLEDALKVVVERMQNQDLDQVALVARLQRETGSNSAEVLDRVVETVRARMELRRLVRTLTAQGRLSRWILTGLPIVLAVVLSLLSPGYLSPLFHKPAGQFMLVLAIIAVVAGSLVIRKIVDIKA